MCDVIMCKPYTHTHIPGHQHSGGQTPESWHLISAVSLFVTVVQVTGSEHDQDDLSVPIDVPALR